ncbi:MAG: efflux RND transporter periplasmic adaptor subunit [Gemmataceae bacterium]|nr:efflux RND transporter periplasmic adaptor subunit [Gemmataceae bacterium]
MGTRSRSLFLLILLLLAGCAPPPADTGAGDQGPIPVTVQDIRPITLARAVPVVGTLDPYKDVTLAPKVDGRVLRVLRDAGDAVFPGDVLVELDSRDYVLEVESARRALEAELARLELTELPDPAADPDGLIDKVPAVMKAHAGLEEASRKLDQQKRLLDRGVGVREDYAVVAAERKVAEATVRHTRTEVRAGLVNARRLKVALDQANQRLADATVRAPVPDEWGAWAAALGPAACPVRYTVAQRFVWEGEMVRAMPEKNVFRLVLDHTLKLRAQVPERYAREVRVGQPAAVRVDAADRPFPGVVARVAPTVDAQTRTFLVEVEVPNNDPAARLKPGTFARAEVTTRSDAGVRTVPPGALVTFAGVTKVFVADGDRAKAVEVKVGQRDKEWVEVIGPLPPNAKVITSGLTQLVDGSAIRTR